MKQNLRRVLLAAALTGLPFLSVSAWDWAPVGTSVVDGFAYYDDAWVGGDVITDDETLAIHVDDTPTPTFNAGFAPTEIADDANVLNVYGTLYASAEADADQVLDGEDPIPCPLKVSGNVVIDASTVDVVVNINEDVVIEPLLNAPAELDGATESAIDTPAHVQFKAPSGKTITVNCEYNLEFRGKTVDTDSYADMLVSFVGSGKTVFKMAGGTKITFNGQIDESNVVAVDAETGLLLKTDDNYGVPSSLAGGTKVFVAMDQSNTATNAKVVFQRSLLDDEDYRDLNTTVEVGPNSLITYLSSDNTGTADNATGIMSFDPSNAGLGRMVLFVRGAYTRSADGEFLYEGTESETLNPAYSKVTGKYPFNDGAVVIAGSYVAESADGDEEVPRFSPANINENYDLSVPAGKRAVLSVTDDLYYAAQDPVPTAYNPAAETTRRGLLVVNDVQSHGKLMSDPYWDLYNAVDDTTAWLPANPENAHKNCRHGFVLGVNGMIDIYHNRFLDHASGALNDVDPMAYNDFARDAEKPYVLKARNPSAFIVDGLDPSLFFSGNPLDSDAVSFFEAADPRANTSPVRATVNLRGSGALYLKHAGSSSAGCLYGVHAALEVDGEETEWASVDWTSALAVMSDATYDGYSLSTDDLHVASSNTEGLHVFDAEGELAVNGVSAAVTGRTYATITSKGVFNASGVQRDYRGYEVNGGDGADFSLVRPFLPDGETTYVRYNKPCLFFNNNVAFSSSILSHSAPSHYVDSLASADRSASCSEPAMVGGERMWFGLKVWDVDAEDVVDENAVIANRASDPNRYRLPEVQLYNSTLELHESLNASGLRFVVKDVYGTPGVGGNNLSQVKFFDHGDPCDTLFTGFGRIFLCGSGLNTMSDDSNNFVTESCSWNVYKHNAPGDLARSAQATVNLDIVNGDEFHPAVQTVIDGLSGDAVPAFKEKNRAHHLFLFAQPADLSSQTNSIGEAIDYAATSIVVDGKDPVCNMSVGWPDIQVMDSDVAGTSAPAAEGGDFPYILPYPSWSNEPLLADMSAFDGYETAFNADPFVPDAVLVQNASVTVKGSTICFGSFDTDGLSISVPVLGDDQSGVVYVKHGGRFAAGRNADGIPGQAVFATMLCQRMWNDYDYDGVARTCGVAGQVDLPSDQVQFDTKYAVQPYNFTADMFAARRDDTAGYVRMSGYNASNDLNDRAGIPAMLMSWYYRDVDPEAAVDDVYASNFSAKSMPKKAHDAMAKMLKARGVAVRSTESVTAPVERPLDLLYVGPGDDVKQMRVCGATMSDPFALAVTGDGLRPLVGRVREFVSQKTESDQVVDHFISEGAHAALFVQYGGRIGLGSRSWNEHSLNAWNLLGKDNVSIMPLGDGTVDLNSNVLVTDRLALMATEDFGKDAVHRVTFYSQEPREIRVPAGAELDLSSFGQAEHRQEIAFAGNVHLVFEAGATLRLPKASSVNGGVVLYFNDQSQLVFEGDQNTSSYVPFSDLVSASNTAPAADSRIRIVGKGQIWANKDAQINVNGNVFVGVQSDAATPVTDLVISIQRQGNMNIGTENVSGGAFQVGNPVAVDGGSVSFSLVLNGPAATFHIDREGFFGLGAGVINKSGAPNGSADADQNPVFTDEDVVATLTDGAPSFVPVQVNVAPSTDGHYNANRTALSSGVWIVKRLYDVASVTIDLQNGVFEHKNIAAGNSSAASMLAVGPAEGFIWNQLGQSKVSVRGGGNVMLVPAAPTGGLVVTNIWDYAGLMTDQAGSGSGESYNIMASGQMLLDRNADGTFAADNAADFFNHIGYQSYEGQASKRVVVSSTLFSDDLAYTAQAVGGTTKYADGSQIVRSSAPATIAGGGDMGDAFEVGALLAQGTTQPTSYAIGR